MGTYKKRFTAIHGITHYLGTRFPNTEIGKVINDTETKDFDCHKKLNEFLKEYRTSVGSLPSDNLEKNVIYVFNGFPAFVKFCRTKFPKNKKQLQEYEP